MDSPLNIPFALLAGVASWGIYRLLYNTLWHPLAKFPGPTLAGASRWWRFQLEIIQGKSLCKELPALHEKYGPVVRVEPDEIHFCNPHAYQEIYNMKNRWDKDGKFYDSFMVEESSIGYLAYKDYKERRDILSKSFSPLAVSQSEGLLTEKVEKLCSRFASYPAGEGIDLVFAFQSFTMDVISYLAFGNCFNALDDPKFRTPNLVALDNSKISFAPFKYCLPLAKAAMAIPPSVVGALSPETKPLLDLQQVVRDQVKDLMRDPGHGLKNLPHDKTIYHRLLDPESFRNGTVPSEKSLNEEALVLVVAGGETVGNALMVGMFYLCRNPTAMEKVKEELKQHWPDATSDDRPSLKELERLPYLNGVIKEALRLSHGVVRGLSRVVPTGGATITGVDVPEGTVVSCGATFVHLDPEHFPNPNDFYPERWLGPDSTELETWLVPFSKGPRMCPGINLGWAELRLAFSHVLRKFDMSLVDPTPEDLEYRELFVPHWEKHVFATVKPSAA